MSSFFLVSGECISDRAIHDRKDEITAPISDKKTDAGICSPVIAYDSRILETLVLTAKYEDLFTHDSMMKPSGRLRGYVKSLRNDFPNGISCVITCPPHYDGDFGRDSFYPPNAGRTVFCYIDKSSGSNPIFVDVTSFLYRLDLVMMCSEWKLTELIDECESIFSRIIDEIRAYSGVYPDIRYGFVKVCASFMEHCVQRYCSHWSNDDVVGRVVFVEDSVFGALHDEKTMKCSG